jgi:HAD superfamily hydrolase (TIGR01484 family)
MALAGSVVARDARKFALVATDLDGTLLNSKHALSPTSKRVLRRLHERGVQVVLCSGRMLFAMEPYERELDIDMPMVCYNGSVVVGRKCVSRLRRARESR